MPNNIGNNALGKDIKGPFHTHPPEPLPSLLQTNWWVSVAHLIDQTVMTILYLTEILPSLQPWGLTSACNLPTRVPARPE